MKVKGPNVAGIFYPSDPETLRITVTNFLKTSPLFPLKPMGFIAPHASYVYSGRVAGVVYKQMQNLDTSKDWRIILIAPSHYVLFEGISFGSYQAFKTPLGLVEVDRERIEKFIQMEKSVRVSLSDTPYFKEHSLEVQLPFLQVLLNKFYIIPVLYGDASPKEIKYLLSFFEGEDTLFVVSSDLSHYYPDTVAKVKDNFCHAGVEGLDVKILSKCEACGIVGITGAILYAKEKGLKGKLLDYGTSAQSGGERHKVVGYGGYVFTS
ncbi:MAG: AmmeMemoRadiSam system protein B [Hydrogenobacter sp.]|uniref:AmmeMemoRadiSam system protein B n=1 Tax=Hydrogenobacter thermophilus TaxID=940 RepID=UPI0030F56EB7